MRSGRISPPPQIVQDVQDVTLIDWLCNTQFVLCVLKMHSRTNCIQRASLLLNILHDAVRHCYGVATISRPLKILGFFCRIESLL